MANSNIQQSDRLRNLIVQGHASFPVLVISVFLFADVLEQPETLATIFAENEDVMWTSAIFVSVSLLLQMLVRAFDHGIFRWGVFAITLFFTGFFLQHSFADIGAILRNGIDMHVPFFLVFYVIGIWTTILCWKWARLDLSS